MEEQFRQGIERGAAGERMPSEAGPTWRSIKQEKDGLQRATNPSTTPFITLI